MTAQLSPSPYPTPGLLQAHWDILGGAWLQSNKRGALDGAVYTVDANRRITIPSNAGGGVVTWVRGVWLATVEFRWDGFMADVAAGQAVDTTNYLTGAINNNGGTTTIQLSSAVSIGASVQVYYSYRNGQKTAKGQGIGGWPQLHLSGEAKNYGTANDGDNYVVGCLYLLYQLTGEKKYKRHADYILGALMNWGAGQGQKLEFETSLAAEESGSGLYFYNKNGATWQWDVAQRPDGSNGRCLRIQSFIPAAPLWGSSGWGWWPERPVSAESPINGIKFEFFGDGSGKRIEISTNLDPEGLPSGEVVFSFPMLASDASKWRAFSLTPSDFFQTANLVFCGDRAPFGGSRWITSWAGPTSFVTLSDHIVEVVLPNGARSFTSQRVDWSISQGSWGGLAFGVVNAVSSAGDGGIYMSLFMSAAGAFDFTVVDALAVTHTVTVSATAGWQLINVSWLMFPGTVVHPVSQIKIDNFSTATGYLIFDDITFAPLKTMGVMNATVMKGLQFKLSSYGAYDVYFDNVEIEQTVPDPYPDVPRWTYSWFPGDGWYGRGAWRGPSAPGYLWLWGWTLSGVVNPATGAAMSDTMIGFIRDAQDAYKTNFPANVKGPVMPRYGRASWEAVADGVLNQWYFEGADDTWYGYQFRAMLSAAHHYYLTGSAVSKAVLDNWMLWIDATLAYNPSTGACSAPEGFHSDGTFTWDYTPLYAHACIAAACIFKYWRDGDPIAQTWYRRLIDDLHNRWRFTPADNGKVAGVYVADGGFNYTAPTVAFTGGGGSGASAIAHVAGGIITHVEMIAKGSGYTSRPTITFVDATGSGAVANSYITDELDGAYSDEHTGWEAAELGALLAMLVVGPRPGGVVNYPLTPTATDIAAFEGLYGFYQRTRRDSMPAMLTAAGIPLHEFVGWSSWHWNSGLYNPLNRDTHVNGDSWTETLGPSLLFAIEWGRYSGDWTWTNELYDFINELTGFSMIQPTEAWLKKASTPDERPIFVFQVPDLALNFSSDPAHYPELFDPNTSYKPHHTGIIVDGGLPIVSRSLQGLFQGRYVPAVGDMTVVDDGSWDAYFGDYNSCLRGKIIYGWITFAGLSPTDAVKFLIARITKVKTTDKGEMTLSLTDELSERLSTKKIPAATYTNTTLASLVQTALTQAGLVWPGDYDQAAWNTWAALTGDGYVTGQYSEGDVWSVLDTLLRDTLSWWMITRDGKFYIEMFADASLSMTEDVDLDQPGAILEAAMVETLDPVYRQQTVKYNGGASSVTYKASVASTHPWWNSARDGEPIDIGLVSYNQALNLASFRQHVLSAEHLIVTVNTDVRVLALDLGDVVKLSLSGNNLPAIERSVHRVIKMEENPNEGRTLLTLLTWLGAPAYELV